MNKPSLKGEVVSSGLQHSLRASSPVSTILALNLLTPMILPNTVLVGLFNGSVTVAICVHL